MITNDYVLYVFVVVAVVVFYFLLGGESTNECTLRIYLKDFLTGNCKGVGGVRCFFVWFVLLPGKAYHNYVQNIIYTKINARDGDF